MNKPRCEQLNLRLSAGECVDMRDAALDAGLSLSEWARIVLRHASGRHQLSEHMETAAEVGGKLVRVAIAGELAKTGKRSKGGAK
jgi:hypothetical protein